MKPHKPRPLNLPHQLQARITDSQLFFIQVMAPNERNAAAQLRKTIERCINIALDTGAAPTALYEHVAQHRPIKWSELYSRGPIPGADHLPEPHYSRVHGYPKPAQPHQVAPGNHDPRPDPFAGWEDDEPEPPHHAAPQHHATAQVYAPAPQPHYAPPAQVAQPIQQPASGPQYMANPYAHLPNSQRPPKYQATRQTRHATPDELAAEGRRAMQHATLEAQGKAPDWEHAPWEEVLPDNQA